MVCVLLSFALRVAGSWWRLISGSLWSYGFCWLLNLLRCFDGRLFLSLRLSWVLFKLILWIKKESVSMGTSLCFNNLAYNHITSIWMQTCDIVMSSLWHSWVLLKMLSCTCHITFTCKQCRSDKVLSPPNPILVFGTYVAGKSKWPWKSQWILPKSKDCSSPQLFMFLLNATVENWLVLSHFWWFLSVCSFERFMSPTGDFFLVISFCLFKLFELVVWTLPSWLETKQC